MKRKLALFIIMSMMFTLLMPTNALAFSGSSNVFMEKDNGWRGNDNLPFGQMKKLEDYQYMDGNRIHVRNQNVKFDVAPVLKGGRTLIPVRAVTEALGCTVEWVEPKAFIIDDESSKIIVFDLSTSKVYVTEEYTYEELLLIEDQAVWDMMEVAIDIGPGLINNRTFVPLRFISEVLGLKVGYDDDTGRIDIDEYPEIDPEEVVVADLADYPDGIDVELTLNTFTFVGIDGLVLDTDFTVDGDVVTLTPAYLAAVEVVDTELEFMFKKEAEDVSVDFDLTMNFLEEEPALTPEEETILVGAEDDLTIDLTLYGFELIQIFDNTGLLTEDTEYTVNEDGDQVVLLGTYLKDLAVGEYTVLFIFDRDGDGKSLQYSLTVEEEPDVLPVIETEDAYFETEEDLPLVLPIDVTLNDYTLKEITGLEAAVDYTVSGDFVVIFTGPFLEGIDQPETAIELVFANGDEEVTLVYHITLEYLFLEPVLTPDALSFTEGETEGLVLETEMELYGFDLITIILFPGVLEADVDYTVDGTTLGFEPSFFEGLALGDHDLMITFKRNDETVYLPLTISVLEPVPAEEPAE